MSVDGTVVKAYARNNRGIRSTADADARFGYKEHNSSGKPVFEFGYRLTIASDARYEVPITGVTTSTNVNEGRLYPRILKQTKNLGLPLDVVVGTVNLTLEETYDGRLHIAQNGPMRITPPMLVPPWPRVNEAKVFTPTSTIAKLAYSSAHLSKAL